MQRPMQHTNQPNPEPAKRELSTSPVAAAGRAPLWRRGLRSALAAAAFASLAAVLVGCPGRTTLFPDEGKGQPDDFASGAAPDGSVGACRLRDTKRPFIVNPSLWNNLKFCNKRTPRRYLRVGYAHDKKRDEVAERRAAELMTGLKLGMEGEQGNVKLLGVVRDLQRQAAKEPLLASRLERDSARLTACDYSRFLNTSNKSLQSQANKCPVEAYDPKRRRDVCLIDTNVREAVWFTSGWDCVAFTDTRGEGASCHRICEFDDYCAAQASCTAPDFALVMCGLGVCLPDKMAGIL